MGRTPKYCPSTPNLPSVVSGELITINTTNMIGWHSMLRLSTSDTESVGLSDDGNTATQSLIVRGQKSPSGHIDIKQIY